MSSQEKNFVIKHIKNKLQNKEKYYRELYIDAVRQYKFLTKGADITKLFPTPIKEDREFQLNLVDFCYQITSVLEKEGINYFLPYGNLLGAVRHKGFIPWDDDFDIELLREDYEKLKAFCKEHFFEIPAEESLYNDFYRYQVIDKYLKKYPNKILYLRNPDCIKIVCGNCIENSYHLDCLPLDFFAENYNIEEHWNYLAKIKDKFSTFKTDKEVLDFLENETKNNKNVLKNQSSSKIYYGIDCWSSYDRYRAQDFFRKEDYLPSKRMKLENREFQAPNNPDRILRLHYGDIYSFPDNLCIKRHLEKHKNSENLLKQFNFNQNISNEKKLVLKRIEDVFYPKTNFYRDEFRRKYGEVKFLKSITDIKSLKCGNKELRQHQLEEFEFCKEIINIMNQNHFQYALCGGSLIGAIRHGGYIPWDDDFDVVMMRNDYTNIIKYAKEHFIEIPPLENFNRFEQFKTMNNYMEKYPNQIIFLHAPHWLRFLKGTNLLDSKFFEIFVLDYFKDDYTMKEHKQYLEKIKLQKLKFNNYKDLLNFYKNEKINNPNIVEKSSKIYYGLDSLGSYIINHEKFMTHDMLFPLKKLKFEDVELTVPNDYDAYIKIQYNDYLSFPNKLVIAPCQKEKREMYNLIKNKS